MKKRNLFILLLSPFLIFLTLSCATTQRPKEPEQPVTKIPSLTQPLAIYTSVTDAQGQPVSNPSVAVDQRGAINVVWWTKGFGEIYFSRSTDDGKSFSKAVNISNTPLSSDHPAVAVDQKGAINVVWDDGSVVPFAAEILFTRSTDGGQTWSTPKNISNTPTTGSTRSNIAVDSTGGISVVWLDGGRVFFTRSTDGGLTWLDSKSVSGQYVPNGIYPPALTVNKGGQIYIAWSVAGSQAYITRSNDGGATFTSPRPISEGRPTLGPSLAAGSEGTLYAVWPEGSSGTLQVLFALSKDQGETFSPPLNISKSGNIPALESKIVVDREGGIWVVWTQMFSGGIPQVLMAYSINGRDNFSQPLNLSDTSGKGWLPNLAVGPAGDVDVVWEHGMKEAIIYSKIVQQIVPVRTP